MIRILQEVHSMDTGGMETQIMKIYREIDKTKIQFDFLVHVDREGFYDEEIKKMGGNIYYTQRYNPLKLFKYKKEIRDFFKSYHYDIVIGHSDMGMFFLREASKMNIPVRIAYSHNAESHFNLKFFFMKFQRFFLQKYATDFLSVSKKAALFLFGKKRTKSDVKIINNGLDTQKFAFQNNIRNVVRNNLKANDGDLVFGHVGRFMPQKNHFFLIDIFEQLYFLTEKTAKLVLIGDGYLKNDVEKIIENKGLKNNVVLLSNISNVNEYLNGFDCFILPSKWEGFPNVIVESLCNGLPSVFSTNVTSEAVLTNYAMQLDLKLSSKEWAIKILEFIKNKPHYNASQEIIDKGFDIHEIARWYEQYYENF